MARLPLPFLVSTALLASWLGGACTSGEDEVEDWADCEGGKCDGPATSAQPITAPDLLVNNLAVLGELERTGFDLGSSFGGASTTNAMLAMSSPRFASLADVIGADIQWMKTQDSEAGVGLAYSHRLFDARWLRSAKTRFRLVAITNRMDLAHVAPGGCGQVRFVYRLMYTLSQGTSRLPMTVMVVRDQPAIGGSCDAIAREWRDQDGTAAPLVRRLSKLGPATSVEINLQAVRWPATARADMGGHAEYLLRVFRIDEQTVAPMPLANTISPTLTAAQRASLQLWIVDHLPEIDRGIALVPDEYLATRAFSVSPRGLARGANRPYLAVFPTPEMTFRDVDFSSSKLVKSPAGLVRRLDTMSCQGCHQSRGMAGFHILGDEDAGDFRSNALEVGTSPHLNDELAWRRNALHQLAGNATITTPRPFAERVANARGIYGAHCGLAGDPSFAAWTCAQGFTCRDLSGDEIGTCVRAEPPGAGDACETSSVTFDPNPRKDHVQGIETLTCGKMPTGRAGYCNHSATKPFTTSAFGGFPNGSCSGGCTTMGSVNVAADAICGAQPPDGFNDCLGAGKPFTTCLANATPAFRRRCDAATPCGDDYVCAGVPGAPKGVGACMPPYFIFQVRVDGHQVQ